MGVGVALRSFIFIAAIMVANGAAWGDAAASDMAVQKGLEEITITGQRIFRSGSLDESSIIKTQVFNADAMEKAHAVNINEVLDKNIGISVQTECSICNVRNIALSNLPGRFTTLMIDGVPLFSSLSSAYGLDSVGVRGAERIEVARGAGASLVAPEAISGVVNIVSHQPQDLELEATADIGRFGWRNLQGYGGFAFDGGAMTVSASYQKHDSVDAAGAGISQYSGYDRQMGGVALFADDLMGFKARMRVDVVSENRGGGALGNDYTAIKADDSGNPFDWRAMPNGSAHADGWFAPDGSGFIPYQSGRAGFSEIIFTDRVQALAAAERKIGGGKLKLAFGYAHNRQDSFYELSTYVGKGNQHYSEISYGYDFGPLALTVGGNYRYESLRSEGVNAAGVSNTGLDDYTYKAPAAFVQSYATLFKDKVEINGSLRLDDHNVFGAIFSPRANILVHHSDLASSRIAVGRGFRAPTSFFEQDHGILDTVRVVRLIDKPERSTNASYAFNYADDYWIVTASYNYNRITNLALLDSSAIDPDTNDPITLFTSAQHPVKVQGADVEATWLVSPVMSLSLGAEKYWFSFEQGSLPFARPDKRMTATLDYDGDRLSIYCRAVWTGSQDLEKFHGPERYNLDGMLKPLKSPGFITIDARAEWYIVPDYMAIFAGVDNLTNYRQATRDSFLWLDAAGNIDVTHLWGPSRGRFIYAGLKVSY